MNYDLTRSIDLLRDLIAFASASLSSNVAISDHVAEILSSMQFDVERGVMIDEHGVEKINLVARRNPLAPSSGTGLAYFCHTDVVPADHWSGPGGDPFHTVVTDDRLYGRGACDMKGSLAAMLVAVASIDHAKQTAPIWIVCTADEERHLQGARHVVANSPAYRELVAHDPVSIIGEPTGCRITYAHKGIVGLRIHSQGRAAHSSTNDGINANVAMVPMLQTLLELNDRCKSDLSLRNNDFDPPTLTWNFGVSDHATAINIVPERSTAWVMFRTMPGVDGSELVQIVRDRAGELGLRVDSSGDCEPLMTSPDAPAVRQFCELAASVHGDGKARTACYATDGAVLTELSQRIVVGPGEIAQAHTTDEFIDLNQLRQGIELYQKAIHHFAYKT